MYQVQQIRGGVVVRCTSCLRSMGGGGEMYQRCHIRETGSLQ